MKCILLCLVVALTPIRGFSQGDSTKNLPGIEVSSLVFPAGLIGLGAVAVNWNGPSRINRSAHDAIWDGGPHDGQHLEDYTLLAPAAAVYALNLTGINGEHNFIDRSVLLLMSNAISNGVSYGIKTMALEQRPDGSDKKSFPSGHTTEAFVSAEFFRLEYRGRLPWTVIAAPYAIGAGTAYLRMYHNKHWLSDVVAGAGLGIASTRLAYLIYPMFKPENAEKKSVFIIMPAYSNGRAGVAGTIVL